MIRFAPPPRPDEVPARFPSPFSPVPHPLARRAADDLRAELERGLGGPGLRAPGGGKMFGVLVVRAPDGAIGALRAFSGMLDDRWEVDGFAPPVFDRAARDAFWPGGEAELAALAAEAAAFAAGPGRAAAEALAALDARHAAALADLAAQHRARRAARHARRAEVEGDPAARHALDQESRGDAAMRRGLLAAHAAERAPIAAAADAAQRRADALADRRAARSRELLAAIWATYPLINAAGERAELATLYPGGAAPGGAGDCAGPKLVAEALRRGLRPLAMAELWWGAPPVAGDRRSGAYYPACRGKCGALLPWMLRGLDVESAPMPGAEPVDASAPRTLYADDHVVAVDKPVGLLSVPGRSGLLRDSVLTRLRARNPGAPELFVVHRLDVDTSGVLLAARDARARTALQAQFARREVGKRYIAWVAGEVAGDAGEIDLPLRVDLDDRPRQIHDPVHGLAAVTRWRVSARAPGRTRLELHPLTGRTHQLRVHAAHPRGLGAPILGDRLYGEPGDRLLLHAEALRVRHPATGELLEIESPAPF